jgi:TP901 family phage tail tape measure protein
MATLTSSLIVQLIDRATGPARGIGAALARLSGQSSRFNRNQMTGAAMARGFAGRLLALGACYVGVDQGIRRTVGAAITFEEAFSDVRKVVNGTDEQLANIKRQIVDMSRVLPTSTEGLSAIFAAAGQSGVPIEELGKFSEMVAKVAVAWDTSESATSEALAKIKTQLHLSVSEVGLLADAINYLSNNSAAKASDLVDYEKRIAAMGDMFGFSKEQTLAFGGAMIAAGGETEVAATSFRNMGKALTVGERATKKQRVAFSRLGLDSVKTAKSMQKNALKTTLDVIERIQKLPDWQRISIASALFGDEARALQPVIQNTTELRRQLGLVGDQANYAGSAYQEYLVRADTTANALAIIGNKIKATLMGVGESWLPTIKEAGKGLGDVLDTLGERAGLIDKVSASIKGFLQGLGVDGGVRQTIDALGDLLFGKADGSGAADQLGRLFETFRRGGAAIKDFWEANKDSPIAKFLGEISGYGFGLFVASAGIAMVAGAVAKLARALFVLSGMSAAVSILKTVASAGAWLTGFPGAAGATAAGSATGAGVSGGGAAATLGKWFSSLKLVGMMGSWASLVQGLGDTPGETFQDQVENHRKAREALQRALGQDGDKPFSWKRFFLGDAADPNFSLRKQMSMDTGKYMGGQNAGGPDVAAALRDTIIQTRPTGTQDVKVTNPVRPNVSVSVMVNAQTNASPQAIGDAVGAAVKSQVEGSFGTTDGGL